MKHSNCVNNTSFYFFLVLFKFLKITFPVLLRYSYIKHCVSPRCTTKWFNICTYCKIIITITSSPLIVTISFSRDENFQDLFPYQLLSIRYSLVNSSHHAVHSGPRTYLSYNWKFVLLDHLHTFFPQVLKTWDFLRAVALDLHITGVWGRGAGAGSRRSPEDGGGARSDVRARICT